MRDRGADERLAMLRRAVAANGETAKALCASAVEVCETADAIADETHALCVEARRIRESPASAAPRAH